MPEEGRAILAQPGGEQGLGECLQSHLRDRRWTGFRAAVAFAKRSGMKHLAPDLSEFSKNGDVDMLVGIDHRGTTFEGLKDLLDALGGEGRVGVFHNEGFTTFHPKVYVFRNDAEAVVIVGSGNLTEGGLFTNNEVSLSQRLDLSSENDRALLERIDSILDEWSDGDSGTYKELTEDLLEDLLEARYVQHEGEGRPEDVGGDARSASDSSPESGPAGGALFSRVPVRQPPSPPGPVRPRPRRVRARARGVPSREGRSRRAARRGFAMTLQRTDAGTGRTTPGTSRRSPEVFIPLAARDADPGFWGWPDEFVEDAARPGKSDRAGVHFSIGGDVVPVNMMTWPVKHDFRLRSEALRSAGNVGDIIRIEQARPGEPFEYAVEVVSLRDAEYARYDAICTNAVRNSEKRWGYY